MTTYGFNFRASAGGIAPLSDGAGETYVLQTDTSPTTRNGITFNWDSGVLPDGRDRLTTGDQRLAGINFRDNFTNESFFKVTLPSTGAWDIRAAFGDGTSGQNQYIRFKEGASAFATYTNVATGANQFVDAGGTLRTSQADWISNNASISHVFTTTDFRVYIADPTGTGIGNSTIAHLFISPSGGGGSPTMGQMIFALQ